MPLATLLWRDTILVASAINLGFGFLALMLLAQGVATATAVAVHFAPLPYNLFLFAALWRRPGRPMWLSVSAVLWLLLATLI